MSNNPTPTQQGETLERFIYTKDNPWSREKAERSQHPDAYEIDNLLCDCCAKYECPNCGLRFKVELPQ